MRGFALAAGLAALVLQAGLEVCEAASSASLRQPIVLRVDATQAPHKMLHAKLAIPARPGPLVLVFPKWIPGEHGPTGPINSMAGLMMSAGGKPLKWRRDDVDMYAFRCTVPQGADVVQIEFDDLTPSATETFSNGASTTQSLALVSWNQLVLYPQGVKPRDLTVASSLQLPAGWKFGTALPVASDEGDLVSFEPVTLETLVDSPLLAGAHFRVVPLTASDPPDVEIDIACDGEAGLAMSPETEAHYRRLVAEADALFGARHFRRYHFLLTLSDHTAHFGLEHHQSSDNRVAERSLIDDDLMVRMASLLPHEYVHSWNGKYRRPAGLATADYQQPMRGELLWVYEGLTQYLGWVLSTRSGLRSPALAREQLADIAAYLDQRPGRTWRPLRDTAVAAQLVFEAPDAWEEWRRRADFYNEGLLIWLEADVLIRQKTNGKKSLEDFCKRFHGGTSGAPQVVPYTFEDVVAGLQAVAANDWRGFLNQRLDSTAPQAPLGGIVNGGWQLAWSDSLSRLQKALEEANHSVDLRYSIGLHLQESGAIIDVVNGRAAERAGVAPGGTVLAVNGRKFTRKAAHEAVRATHAAQAPLELLVESGDFFTIYRLDYHDGERCPRLQRDPARPDVVSEILTPRTEPGAGN